MATKSSTVTVQILADNSQYKREMGETARVTDHSTKQMGDSTDRVGQKMSTFAKVAAAALAVAAVAAVKNFVGDSIRAFSDLNESMNAVEVTFGENAAGIKKLGEEAAGSLGLSNAEFNSFAVQMSAFAHQIAGDGGDVVGVVDELSTRVSDFASVMNLEVAEAARLFQSGLAGETEPLRKYGIDLSAQAVKAHALAEGIADGTGELTEQEKVLGRHSLLMKQTDKVAGDFANTIDDYANAQRVANAEMENAKARVGEVLVPVAQLTTKLQLLAAEALGMVALGIQNLTGEISNVDYALGAFENHTGAAADSLAAAVTINQKYGISFEELFDRMELAEGALAPLTASQEKYLESIGYTSEEIDALNELTSAYSDEADLAARTNTGALVGFEKLSGGIEDVAEETDEATSALQTFEDEVRSQTDPLYALVTANEDLATATAEVKTAAKEYGEDSPEYVAALMKQAQAFDDVTAAQLAVAEQSGFTRDDFQKHLRDMAIFTDEQIQLILKDFDEVEAFKFSDKTINVRTKIGDEVRGGGGPRAKGGPVEKGVPYLVGEQGPEVIIPATNGTVIPNNKIATNGTPIQNGTPGNTIIYLTVSTLDPQAGARAIVEALQTWNRNNGALPITVRT